MVAVAFSPPNDDEALPSLIPKVFALINVAPEAKVNTAFALADIPVILNVCISYTPLTINVVCGAEVRIPMAKSAVNCKVDVLLMV